MPPDRRGLDASAPLTLDSRAIRRAGEPRLVDSTAIDPDMLLLGRAGPLSRNRSAWLSGWAAEPSPATSWVVDCVDELLKPAFDGLKLRLLLRRISGCVRERLALVGDAKEGLLGIRDRGGGGSGGVVDSLLSSSRSLLRRGGTLRRFGADSSMLNDQTRLY